MSSWSASWFSSYLTQVGDAPMSIVRQTLTSSPVCQVIVVLAFIKGYVQLRQVNTPFVHTLYEDGMCSCSSSLRVAEKPCHRTAILHRFSEYTRPAPSSPIHLLTRALILQLCRLQMLCCSSLRHPSSRTRSQREFRIAASPHTGLINQSCFRRPLRVIHSILCTHVVLRLRACIRDRLQNLDADGQAPFTITAVAFTTPHAPVGIDTLQDLESQVDNWSIMSDDSSISGE